MGSIWHGMVQKLFGKKFPVPSCIKEFIHRDYFIRVVLHALFDQLDYTPNPMQ